jgi:uncharacterized protein (TIGR04255 family)
MTNMNYMGETRFDDLPSFDRPPVIEVAVGVHFLQLTGLNTVSLVRMVDDLWRGTYPTTTEQPPLPTLALPGKGPTFAFQLQAGAPPVRLWSLSEDQSLLVQVQHDRLLLNWRKLTDDAPYPRYRKLREDFTGLWREFASYVGDHDFGVLQPSIAEVSFFNRIPIRGVAEIPEIIRALNPRWSLDKQVAAAYQMERDLSDLLTTGSQNVAVNFRPVNGPMQLEISTLIGVDTADGEVSDVLAALDTAHQFGVLTFDELVTDNAHSRWGKQR